MTHPSHGSFRSSVSDSDDELLQRTRKAPEGDLRAFEELVLRYQRRVVSNCRYMTRDANNAEDLAQEVMIKAFFGVRDFEGRSSYWSWLQRIKINHCLNYLKKQGDRFCVGIGETEVDDFDQLKVWTTAEKLAEAIGERLLIGEVLDSMPTTLRVPLVLCDMDELSYEEVADALGIGLSAAKMRVKRGREAFRERYERLKTGGVATGPV
jgi:RNA polymerase sigma-70 factor (ECF subfamily)